MLPADGSSGNAPVVSPSRRRSSGGSRPKSGSRHGNTSSLPVAPSSVDSPAPEANRTEPAPPSSRRSTTRTRTPAPSTGSRYRSARDGSISPARYGRSNRTTTPCRKSSDATAPLRSRVRSRPWAPARSGEPPGRGATGTTMPGSSAWRNGRPPGERSRGGGRSPPRPRPHRRSQVRSRSTSACWAAENGLSAAAQARPSQRRAPPPSVTSQRPPTRPGAGAVSRQRRQRSTTSAAVNGASSDETRPAGWRSAACRSDGCRNASQAREISRSKSRRTPWSAARTPASSRWRSAWATSPSQRSWSSASSTSSSTSTAPAAQGRRDDPLTRREPDKRSH